MRCLTGFSRLPEILADADTVNMNPNTGRYCIDADAETISNHMTELQAMSGVLNAGLAALNMALVDLTNEADLGRNQLSDILSLQAGLNELSQVISDATHAIGEAIPTGRK